jgi:hypothetical protein
MHTIQQQQEQQQQEHQRKWQRQEQEQKQQQQQQQQQRSENKSFTADSDVPNENVVRKRDPLLFCRYVPMFAEESLYDPPFCKPNPLTIPIEDVEKNGQFQTHLIEMIMYEQEHEKADVGIPETREENVDCDEERIEFENAEDENGNISDAYQSARDGLFFAEEDRKMGFVPNETLFRLGNGTPLAPEDILDSVSMTIEEREEKKKRIYKSICSLNPFMHFVYVRTKRQAILIERTSQLSLYSKLVKLYDCIVKTLQFIEPGGTSIDTNKIKFLIWAFEKNRETLLKLATGFTRAATDVDDHTYALAYNVHRTIFDGSELYREPYPGVGFVHPTFVALVGQETWLLLHYLLPSMNRSFKKTVGVTFYEDGSYLCNVDVYSYVYGEVFVRDFYRFEIVSHELYLKSIKMLNCCTDEDLYDSVLLWSSCSDLNTFDIVKLLKIKIRIAESDVPILCFWTFDLIKATKEANDKRVSNDETTSEITKVPSKPNATTTASTTDVEQQEKKEKPHRRTMPRRFALGTKTK